MNDLIWRKIESGWYCAQWPDADSFLHIRGGSRQGWNIHLSEEELDWRGFLIAACIETLIDAKIEAGEYRRKITSR
jgi:hypothetical protein